MLKQVLLTLIVFCLSLPQFLEAAVHMPDIHASGNLQVLGSWRTSSDLGFPTSDNADNQTEFSASQFFHFQFDVNRHDEVSFSLLLEEDTVWGKNKAGEFSGGQVGTDGVNIQTSHFFMQWMPEDAPLVTRLGLNSVVLPNQVGGNIILDDTVASILATYHYSKNSTFTLLWGRPYYEDPAHTTMDLYALGLQYAPDDHILSPYIMFSDFGRDVSGDPLGDSWVDGGNIGLWNGFSDFSGNPWAVWAGLSGRYHISSALSAKADLMWGTLDGGHDAASRRGAVLLGELSWYLQHMTVNLLGWWGTGDSSTAYKDGAGRMPFVTNQWGLTGFGYYRYGVTTEPSLVIQDTTGRWTLGLILSDINFIDQFVSEIQLLYMRGTNHPDSVKNNRFSPELLEGGYRNNWGTYLTTHDWLIELDAESTFSLYEELNLIFRFGYIHIDVDPSVWGTSDTKDAYKGTVILSYQF